MSKTQVQTLKGFRDFLPQEARLRQVVSEKIRQVFEIYGFAPLQTPTLEYASLLLGKYGTEADKLVYTFADRGEREVGLRYDQTVPTARVLAQYQNELPKYFRRYQMQNVFRADKPQKGRYREFTQCDVDIFGSRDSIADAELLATVNAVFENLGLENVVIEINDRQLLISNLQPFSTATVDVFSIIQSIDKLDKMPPEAIVAELVDKGLALSQAQAVIDQLNKIEMSDSLKDIEQKTIALGVKPSNLVFNPKLARGLDYYTGLIFEIKMADGDNQASLGGGGRYDNLIKDLSGYDMPAVGVGLGFDRIVEVYDSKNTKQNPYDTQVLVGFTDEEGCQMRALEITKLLRQQQIRTEVFPAVDKLAKQFKVAEQKNIPFVLVVGGDELASQKYTLKNMQERSQEALSIEEIISKLSTSIN
jgi:histidyl-tRNA synthetase